MNKVWINFELVKVKQLVIDPERKDQQTLTSVVSFNIDFNRTTFNNLSVEIAQPYGSGEIGGIVEVPTSIANYNGPYDRIQFLDAVMRYYDEWIGIRAKVLRTIDPVNHKLTIQNSIFAMPYSTTMNID